MLECVVNISEGRRSSVISEIAGAAGQALLDVHTDPHHHRSVLTLAGDDACRSVARAAVEHIDLREHQGVHPRIGAVDVVPFVPLGESTMADALRSRNEFARWMAEALAVPSFLYGPERSLPALRRAAQAGAGPDVGPEHPHPTAGSVAVGARPVLVAYNVWLEEPDMDLARRIAGELRSAFARTLAFRVGEHVQVSANLLSPDRFGPAELFDAVASQASVARAELVGLVPTAALDRIDPRRWRELDLSAERTIESRLIRQGLV